MASKTTEVYDLEIFQNCFTATFMEVPSRVVHQFVIMPGRDERQTLIAHLDKIKTLISFNGISFDTPLLRYIQQRAKSRQLNDELYLLGQQLIDDGARGDSALRNLRYPRKQDWRQIDLMKINSFDMLGVGLKQVAINLCWPRIQELPFEYDRMITLDEVDTVLDYNLNDVGITHKLYQTMREEILLRQQIGAAYHVDVMSAARSKIANVILEHAMGDRVSEVKNLRTVRHEVSLARLRPAGTDIPNRAYAGTPSPGQEHHSRAAPNQRWVCDRQCRHRQAFRHPTQL
jgi:hypothetical protein